MAGTGGASMVEIDGSCDSKNRNKRIKSGEEEEDRISALPDVLIHRILSFLPATDLVRTLILSKRWKSQWTHVPVLEFVPIDGMSLGQFSNFIEKTLILHNCSHIHKFVINLESFRYIYPNLDLLINFAVRKEVKELIVNVNEKITHWLPEFLFNSSPLVTMKFSSCYVRRFGKVNWVSLKSLCLHDCEVQEGAIENVLSGSPLLEYLEICESCAFFGHVIASKSLKTLILDVVECHSELEISCPNLERLRISGLMWFTSLKLVNLPSSVYATLDFDLDKDDHINLVQQTLQQVQHVEKLEIGHWIMKILSSSKEVGDCIGGLPDSFIHRILAFLSSTKDYYGTWQHKWTHDVPVLNFVCNEKLVIDSKHISLAYLGARLSLWIRFAARKDVKELVLDCDGANVELGQKYPLPQFLFNNSSLVKIKISACDFMPNGKVNWECVKSLQLDHSVLGNQAIEHVLSGSPLLEYLELRYCRSEGAVVVASEHLKAFIIEDFGKNCPLLEISCPNLENLKISGNFGSTSLKFMNLPSSLHATLEMYVLGSDNISPAP